MQLPLLSGPPPPPIPGRSGVWGCFPNATTSWRPGKHPRPRLWPSPAAGRLSPGFLLLQALGFWGRMPQSFGPRPLLPPVGAGRDVREVRAGPEGGGKGQLLFPQSCLLPRGDWGPRAGATLG